MEQMESKQRSIITDFYAAHREELTAFVASRLPSADGAEDIVQEVFLKLLRTERMITPVTLPCLVYTTARNLVFDLWRHRRAAEEYEHVIAKTDWQPRKAEGVESIYAAHEVEEMLERGIARLTDRQTKVYRLNIYEGMQVGEISLRLGMKYKTVENHLGTARRQVREYLRKCL